MNCTTLLRMLSAARGNRRHGRREAQRRETGQQSEHPAYTINKTKSRGISEIKIIRMNRQ